MSGMRNLRGGKSGLPHPLLEKCVVRLSVRGCAGGTRYSAAIPSGRLATSLPFCPYNLTLVPVGPIILTEPLVGLAVAIGFTFLWTNRPAFGIPIRLPPQIVQVNNSM